MRETSDVTNALPPEHPFAHLPFHLQKRLGLLEHHTAQRLHELAHEHIPAWLRPTKAQNRLPVTAAVLAAIGLQFALPTNLSLHPRWLLPGLELVLLIALSAANPVRLSREAKALRIGSVVLVAVITLANAVSAALLASKLVTGHAGEAGTDAAKLLLSGASIYLTNVIAFGLWFWEYDRGGPFARQQARRAHPDFLFPQMVTPDIAHPDWEPLFVDYLYTSFTNATAFSPTDTMPMSRWAKTLMAVQSGVSLITVALVIARAVNIFK